jgi:uncharacterized protein YutE (UPF0331/DUF86 family)
LPRFDEKQANKLLLIEKETRKTVSVFMRGFREVIVSDYWFLML